MKQLGKNRSLHEAVYSNGAIALWTLFGAVVLTLRTGYIVDVGSNHPLQMIVIQKILSPDLYPNDPFVEQSWHAYTSVLWQLTAFLMQWFSLDVISAILYVPNRLLLSFAAIYTAIYLFGNRPFAPLIGLYALITIPHPFIGDGNPIRNYVEQTGFAFALGLLAIIGQVQRKGWLTALALSGCFVFNTMYGAFAMVYLIAALLTTESLRSEWKHWLGWMALGIALGAPGWMPTLLAGRQPYDVEAAWKVSEIAYPWHFYMVSGRANLLFIIFVILTLIITKYNKFLSSASRNHLWLWTGIAMFWYLVAHLSPFLSLDLLRLHPIRGQDYWHPIAMANLCGYLVLTLEQRLSARLSVPHFHRALVSLMVFGLVGLGVFHEFTRVRNGGGLYRNIFNVDRQPAEVRRVAEWAKANTSIEDVFLIPITMQGPWVMFRHLSERNIYLHWKDATGWPYAIWYSSEFLQRLRDLGFFEKNQIDESAWRKGDWIFRKRVCELDNLPIDEATVLRLAGKYRIDYWITSKETPTSLPVVYQDKTVKVVRVTPSTDGKQPDSRITNP